MKVSSNPRLASVALVAVLIVLAALAVVARLAGSSGDGGALLQPAPVLGVTIDAEMNVVGVEPDSPADRAGVQPGDILEQFDNVRLTGSADTTAAKLAAKLRIANTTPDQKLKLRLERDGQKLEVDVISTSFKPPSLQHTPTPVVEPNYYF